MSRRVKKEGQPEADFINIVAWNKTAEFVAKYFIKGMQVALTGRITTRNYDDKDGKKIYVTEIVAEEVFFADTKKNEARDITPQETKDADGNVIFTAVVEDENLPF